MEEEVKIGFWKRIKLAIFNLEKYSIFAKEKFSKALKYIVLLTLLVTAILSLSSTIRLSQEAGKLINYVKSNDFPDFELKDDKLEASKFVNSYDKEYNSRLIIDTTDDLSKGKIQEYKDISGDADFYAIFLKDKVIMQFGNGTNNSAQTQKFEETYGNVLTMLGKDSLSKSELVSEYLNDDALTRFKGALYVYAFMTILLMNIITLVEDIVIIGIFGWIASKIAKVALSLAQSMSLAIYSLTLSIILSTIYSVVYSFTGFEIKYFEVMYMIIAYIYIVASIMIMKESNNGAGEVVTATGVVMNTPKEENSEEEKEEESKDQNKDNDKDKEDADDKEDNNLKENEGENKTQEEDEKK